MKHLLTAVCLISVGTGGQALAAPPVSAGIDPSDNSTQQVKLTFDSRNAACHGGMTAALRNMLPGQH